MIGILAVVAIAAYSGINSRATSATLQSDLSNGSNQLKLYSVENGSYPESMASDGNGSYCPSPPDTRYCIKASPGNTYTYQSSTPFRTFSLIGQHGDIAYSVTDDTSPVAVSGAIVANCEPNYIAVPGSATYGTSDFCVMKYEAKNVAGVATSQAGSLPWVSISQTAASTASSAACDGCHLITEAEWLTIAQNVLGVSSNWSTGTVGSGYIYSGHNDGSSGSAAADTDDGNGYVGTGNVSDNQRRTLTLSNGEVIWDMAGNVYEKTSGTATGGQPGATSGYSWRQWPLVTNPGTLPLNPSPTATGISGAGSWDGGSGIGYVYSSTAEVGLRAIMRGGDSYAGPITGIMNLNFSATPSATSAYVGFRVSQ